MKNLADMDIAPVWDSIHGSYIREHIGNAVDITTDIASMLDTYIATGERHYWKEAMNLVNVLQERMTVGSLARIKKLAYFVCERCDSDICDHALEYNG